MGEKATIIVFSGDLDKVLAALNIALGALSMGMEVSMFFTFWGLNAVRREKPVKKPSDWMKRMMGLLNRGGADKLKLSRFHMLGIGTFMMKKIIEKSNFPSIKEMIQMASNSGVTIIACTTSMEMMGVAKEDLINEVDKLAGVATYLADAKESKVNLFI